MNQANKYRLLALARKGWYAPDLENMDQEVPDSLNRFMVQNEENRQLSGSGLSYNNYRVGRTRRRSKVGSGLGVTNQAFNYYKSTGEY